VNIQLTINGKSLALGMSQNLTSLSAAGFKKMGLFSRGSLPIQKMPGDVIFFAKNPTITIGIGSDQANLLISSEIILKYPLDLGLYRPFLGLNGQYRQLT